jgi:hypothetical protein
LRYTAAKCSDDLHFTICQDMSEIRLPAKVNIEITDTAMTTTYFNEIVQVGGDAIAFGNGTCISDNLAVFITDAETDLLLQVLELPLGCWGTSGMELLSVFGAVEFAGYTCSGGIVRNCYGAIDWAFVAQSNSDLVQRVSRFEVVFNGESLDLLTKNSTTAVSTIGGSKTPELRQDVRTGLEFCSGSFYNVELIVEATEPSGRTCTTTTTLDFGVVAGGTTANDAKAIEASNPPPSAAPHPDLDQRNPELDASDVSSTDPTTIAALTSGNPALPSKEEVLPASCGLTAVIDCKLPNGVPCANVIPPDHPSCHGGSGNKGDNNNNNNNNNAVVKQVSSLAFSYQNIPCRTAQNAQTNSTWLCTDLSALYEGPVQVQCKSSVGDDDPTELVVTPRTVGPGGTVTVTAPKTTTKVEVLPSSIVCTLYGPSDRVMQKNVIDVSAPLLLGDQFGALQVEACDDLSCQERFRYEMRLQNNGTAPVLVTDASFIWNGSGGTPLNLDGHALDPGDSALLEVTVQVDVCRGGVFEAALEVTAAQQGDGEICTSRNSTRLRLPRVWE